MIEEQYYFKRVSEDSYSDLVELYKSSFNLPISEAYFKNKQNTGFLGASHIGYIAYSKNHSPAAFYGVYPYLCTDNSEKILAAQSGDTMTHPDHRGKGLFPILAQKTFDLAKKEGVNFIFGFPNENSYPVFIKKLGWTHHENLNSYVIEVRSIPFSPLFNRIKPLKNIYNSIANILLKKYSTNDFFYSSVLNGTTFGSIKRDINYYRYKSFLNNYIIKYKTASVWIKLDESLFIGDMDCKNQEEFNDVINFLIRKCKLLGIRKIRFQCCVNTLLDEYFKNIVTPTVGVASAYLNLNSDSQKIENIKFTLGDFDTF